MGRREMGLIFILFCSTMANSSSLQQIFPTESNYHQQTNREKHGQDGVTYRIGRKYSASVVTVSHVAGARGGSAAGRGGGHGGGSRAHTGGGATATIPIYTAGGSARASHHQGRPPNAGNRHENNMVLLVAAVLAAIAHMYRLF